MGLSKEERREKRQQRKQKKQEDGLTSDANNNVARELSNSRMTQMLLKNEDELLEFVAQVNKVYQEKLGKPAPFMTFVICGMQSTGKSTIMERFMGAVLNIVQEGTGTRCPLDTTCIHDDSCTVPKCDLSGKELDGGERRGVTLEDVFGCIVRHNKKLGDKDRFSTEPLRLIFRSKSVQNMRFVDTPGIIENESVGRDNREDIKTILRSEISKPNTKLCVLLEPKEFVTNSIVNFCDDAFGSRNDWVEDATFVMTKFDKQLEDARTGGKANKFFQEYKDNFILPFLAITPTLPKEDLPHEELFLARQDLLDTANAKEKDRFVSWLNGHKRFLEEDPNDELLGDDLCRRVGFPAAKQEMREIMLRDTAARLPEVIESLRKELARCEKEAKKLEEKKRFNDPAALKIVIGDLLVQVRDRVTDYLDGDLMSSIKFPDRLQDLEDEIEEEELSEWAEKELNHFTEAEEVWRERISELDGKYPKGIQSEKMLLGGKQAQRAINFFNAVLITSLPDPNELKEYVANGTGYLGGGLQHENWERAIVQIIKVSLKEVSHPGINYLIKHVGSIFRRLFSLAMDDIKKGEVFSATFNLLPASAEKYVVSAFDDMLWALMEKAANQTHSSMEPMYSTVDPDLPTFRSNKMDASEEERKAENEGLIEYAKKRMQALSDKFSGEKAKQLLRDDYESRATTKKSFLPDKRTSMITDEETDMILRRSFEYIVALMEFQLVYLKFQINHFLFQGFKEELGSLGNRVIFEADWEKLVEKDPDLEKRLVEIKENIKALNESLQDVGRMHRKM